MENLRTRSLLIWICIGAAYAMNAEAAFADEKKVDGSNALVEWRSDYNAARKESHDTKRPMFFLFRNATVFFLEEGKTTDLAAPSNKLEEGINKDRECVRVLNSQFIPLKLISSDEEHEKLFKALRIESVPTVILAGPDGRILNIMVGFQESDKLLKTLRDTLEKMKPRSE